MCRQLPGGRMSRLVSEAIPSGEDTMKKTNFRAAVAAMIVGGALAGAGAAWAAAAATNEARGYNGEDEKTRAEHAAFNAPYEDDAKVGGGGAMQRVLVDNEVTRVNLVSFKKGHVRPGPLKRKYHQLLVYVDTGKYTLIKNNDGTPVKERRPSTAAPGSAIFHWKDTLVGENLIDEDYRVLFVEMKK